MKCQTRVKLRTGIVEDLNDLPPTLAYLPDEDLYVLDNRWINSYAVNRTGTDLELRYEWERGANEFGFTLLRSYNHRYDVQQSVISTVAHDLVGGRDDTGQEETTILPVPTHKTSMQFTWTHGGLFLALDMQAADDTTILYLDTQHRITKPATKYDLVLSYEFGDDTLLDAPAWMDGLSTTLTVNNLTHAFTETTAINPETGEVRPARSNLNPAYELSQGRAYLLTIHKSF